MTNQEFKEYNDNKWKELSIEIKHKAKEILLQGLGEYDKQEIKLMYNRDPINWSSPYHTNWGMSIRNYLCREGIDDNSLPSKNWDDYYTQCVEYALGLREE
jgi:hypothetical protein